MTDPTRSASEAYCQWCRSNERCPEMDELIAERDALIRERDEAREDSRFWQEKVATLADGGIKFGMWVVELENEYALALSTGIAECKKLRAEVARCRSLGWKGIAVQACEDNVELTALCNALMTAGLEECEKLLAEIDQCDSDAELTIRNLDMTITERDSLATELVAMRTERDRKVSDTAQAWAWHQRQNTTEFERLYARINEAEEHAERLVGQRDNYANELTAMTKERDDLRSQLDAMTKERDEFRAVGMHCVEASHAALAEVTKECEQLQVQLAGCGAAALGYEKDPAKPGDYGWSASYNDTVVLRRMYDEARERVKALEGAAEQAFRADDKYGYESIATCVAFDELRRVARKGGE